MTTERLTDERLAELERLEREATPGPWEGVLFALDRLEATERERMKGYIASAIDRGGGDALFGVICEKPDGRADACHTGNGPTSEKNAVFVAAARNALPSLLAEVRALRASRAAAPPGLAGRNPGEIARAFHDAYEALAPHFGYRTREASAKPWDEVPETNRDLMVATVRAVLFEPQPGAASPDREEAHASWCAAVGDSAAKCDCRRAPPSPSGGPRVPLIDNGRGQLVYAPTEKQGREADAFIRSRLAPAPSGGADALCPDCGRERTVYKHCGSSRHIASAPTPVPGEERDRGFREGVEAAAQHAEDGFVLIPAAAQWADKRRLLAESIRSLAAPPPRASPGTGEKPCP